MKILIVGLVKNKQLKRLQQEGQKKGHQVDGCYASDLIIHASLQSFKVQLKNNLDISQYQIIYLWTTGKRRWEWYVAAHFLNQHYQTKIINQKILDPAYLYYLSPASEYLKQFQNKLPFPQSSIIFNSNAVSRITSQHTFPVIIKTSTGRQGKGVFKANTIKDIKQIIKDHPNSPAFIVRQFIPNNGDIRIFTVGYKTIGAMKRTPKTGDFRSNISQGGSGSNFNLDQHPKIKQMAEKLSHLTQTEIAGVDIIIHNQTQQPYILEINPGPQFLGLEKYTSTNAAKEIITYFESLI